MSPSVINQPRLVWETALSLVRTAAGPGYYELSAQVLKHLGAEYYGEYANTRQRLLSASVDSSDDDRFAHDVETSRWRVRLEELLRNRPDLVETVQQLSAHG
jgi:hypothetical protein